MERTKHVFWQALIFTVVIFGLGIILGFFLEGYRADLVASNLARSEINLLDEQLRVRVLSDFDVSCDDAVESVFSFADNVFWEAQQLEEYDSSSQLSRSFIVLHRRYDLLRSLIWLESIELKNKCGDDFHTLVYLYDYSSEDIDLKSRQVYMSRALMDLKEKYPDKILLIPIAVNMELSSVDLMISSYSVEEFPAIIVDEGEVISEIKTLDELENIIFHDEK